MEDEMNRNISVDAEDQISGLIAGLPRVSAPTDFDLKLRGRIARHKSAYGGGYRLPAALKYAMGLGVVLVAFGLFGMAWIYSGQLEDVPEVATTVNVPASAPTTVTTGDTVRPAVSALEPAVNRQPAVRSAVPAARPRLVANPSTSPTSPGPAEQVVPDSALKTATAVYPQGIRPADAGVTPEVTAPVIKPVDAKEVLAVLGANAAFSDGKMRIESVNAGSAAENAGLKAGDVVESINGQSINSTSKFAGDVKASSMRVQRDGKLIGILMGR